MIMITKLLTLIVMAEMVLNSYNYCNDDDHCDDAIGIFVTVIILLINIVLNNCHLL